MVSQGMKMDAKWPSLEESLEQAHSASTLDALPISAASAPQPMDGLQNTAPPPFLTKTYDMVDDHTTDAIVSWSTSSNSFVVWNPPEFSQELLPKYFKHNNFSSFVRQLNTYGFRKVDPDRWEFANECFLRGRRDLLRGIHRRKPTSQAQQVQHQQEGEQSLLGPSLEIGKLGLEGEIEMLKKDKNVLMHELVRLRQQQQSTEQDLRVMGQRLQVTEQRQQQMMTFLAKAMQNPAFLAQLMQQSESNKRLAATVRKKRRLPKQDEGGEDSLNADSPPDGQMVTFQPNGAGEPKGARSMLMQFLNALESSSPNHDSTPLDTLFRDMSSGMSIPETNTLNRQSGVTLTEMQMSGLPDTLPVVTDVPDESMLHISPPPTSHIPRLEGKVSSFMWFFEMPISHIY
jgi:heat shock transcription factor